MTDQTVYCPLMAANRLHGPHRVGAGRCPGIQSVEHIHTTATEGVVITDNRFLQGDPVPSEPSPYVQITAEPPESPWVRVGSSLNVLLAVLALTGLACAPAVIWAVWKWALS